MDLIVLFMYVYCITEQGNNGVYTTDGTVYGLCLVQTKLRKQQIFSYGF